MTDKDRPSTWTPFRPGLCEACTGACCTMPVEVRLPDLERLGLVEEGEVSLKKIARRLSREGIVRSFRAGTGLFLLEPQNDGSCPFLGKDRLCTVYDRRPDLCRDFPTKVGPRLGFCPFKRKGSGRAP